MKSKVIQLFPIKKFKDPLTGKSYLNYKTYKKLTNALETEKGKAREVYRVHLQSLKGTKRAAESGAKTIVPLRTHGKPVKPAIFSGDTLGLKRTGVIRRSTSNAAATRILIKESEKSVPSASFSGANVWEKWQSTEDKSIKEGTARLKGSIKARMDEIRAAEYEPVRGPIERIGGLEKSIKLYTDRGFNRGEAVRMVKSDIEREAKRIKRKMKVIDYDRYSLPPNRPLVKNSALNRRVFLINQDLINS